MVFVPFLEQKEVAVNVSDGGLTFVKLLEKLKTYTPARALQVTGWHIARLLNAAAYGLCRCLPLNRQLIVLESEGDLSDNGYAFYDYLLQNGYLRAYRVVWLVEDPKSARRLALPNTVFVSKDVNRLCFRRSLALATCRYSLYDHCNLLADYRKRPGCTVINLWHGCGFKADKGAGAPQKTPPDKIVLTGPLYLPTQMAVFGRQEQDFLDLGYPRNDYLFGPLSDKQERFAQRFRSYRKVFLWMPTFRRSINPALTESYFQSATGLPLLDDGDKLARFNDWLAARGCLCILKVHHLQAKLEVFRQSFSHLLLLKDDDLHDAGLQLYQMLPLTDCLITDYSSIANDYMLLDKPIIYTLDDYDDYRRSRGLIPPDPIRYFVGHQVVTPEGLFDAMADVISGADPYRAARAAILPRMHTHPDGRSAQRIADYLNL